MFNTEGRTAELATNYLQIVSIAMLFAGPTISMDAALRAIGKTKVTLYMSIAEIGTNVALSFILIFGYFGAPALGLTGAAYGTVAARLLRVIISLLVIQLYNPMLILRPRDFSFRRSTLVKYFNITAPIIAGSLIWSGGIFTYQLIMGRAT